MTYQAPEVKQPITIEEKIAYYFPEETEIMINVFKCESGLRQFDDHGKTIISPTNDSGIAQINIATWDKQAKKMDLNYMDSVNDNLKMARHIYDVQGKSAWVCYKKLY